MTDPINPGYYQRGDAQLIDFLETLPYNRGAAGKYIIRAGDKDPATLVQDLEKALWYVRRELARVGHPDEAKVTDEMVEKARDYMSVTTGQTHTRNAIRGTLAAALGIEEA